MNIMYFYCYNLQTNPKNTSVTQLFTLLRLGDLWVYWETTPVMIVIKSFTKIFLPSQIIYLLKNSPVQVVTELK